MKVFTALIVFLVLFPMKTIASVTIEKIWPTQRVYGVLPPGDDGYSFACASITYWVDYSSPSNSSFSCDDFSVRLGPKYCFFFKHMMLQKTNPPGICAMLPATVDRVMCTFTDPGFQTTPEPEAQITDCPCDSGFERYEPGGPCVVVPLKVPENLGESPSSCQ